MTLCLMGINVRAVWMSSDHRVSLSGRTLDDESIKAVSVLQNNARWLISFTGLAYIGDRHISEWLVDRLTGYRFDSLHALSEFVSRAANEDLGHECRKHRVPHSFLLGGFQEPGEGPWGAMVTIIDPATRRMGREFSFGGRLVQEPVMWPVGVPTAVLPTDRQKLDRALRSQGKPEDIQALFAVATKRAATSRRRDSESISPHCQVSFMRASGDVRTTFYRWGKPTPAPEPPVMPSVTHGWNTTNFTSTIKTAIRGTTPEAQAELEAAIEQAGKHFRETTGRDPNARLHRPPPYR